MTGVTTVTTTAPQIADYLENISELWLTDTERNFQAYSAMKFGEDNWHVPLIAVICYLSMCFIGTKIMTTSKAYELKIPLAVWNLLLCIFSTLGMIRFVPYFLAFVLREGFEASICSACSVTWCKGPAAFWMCLFSYSKLVELFDTAFIVLRKRPLLFLHWYHHVTVLLFCWFSYRSSMGASGMYWVAMNYTIHAIMYGYYCISALGLKPQWFPAYVITLLQITQMIVGTTICLAGWYYHFYQPTNRAHCFNDLQNLVAGAVMYASYFYLFGAFAAERYIPKNGAKSNGNSRSTGNSLKEKYS